MSTSLPGHDCGTDTRWMSRMISPFFHRLTGYLPPIGTWSALRWFFFESGVSRCTKIFQSSPTGLSTFQ